MIEVMVLGPDGEGGVFIGRSCLVVFLVARTIPRHPGHADRRTSCFLDGR